MVRRVFLVVAAGVMILGVLASRLPEGGTTVASDSEIRALLVDHVDVQHKSVGSVVGIVTPQGRRILSYGRLNQGDPRPLDGDTVFEVGSVTKIFTALLLADMVQRGEVALKDPATKYLGAGVKVPGRGGKPIVLVDLATHTSGLPFFPPDIPLKDPVEAGRAIAKYSVNQVHEFLAQYELPTDPGSRWAYSNLGYALLGEALARRFGKDYEVLIRERITSPLGLESTAITVSPQMRPRLAIGHDAHLQVTPEVAMPAFVPAGCLRSSANDLLTLLSAFTGDRKSSLAPAMAAMFETRRPGPGVEQALGWWIVKVGADDAGFVAFGGQTLGYATTLAYDPKTRMGVVVLSNGTQDDGGLGWHLLRPSFPVATAATQRARDDEARKEVTLDPKVLDTYAGEYRVASGPTAGDIATIERRGDVLVLKAPTTPPEGVRLHAKDEHDLFLTEANIHITVETDIEGRARRLIFHFAGTDTAATRIDASEGKQ